MTDAATLQAHIHSALYDLEPVIDRPCSAVSPAKDETPEKSNVRDGICSSMVEKSVSDDVVCVTCVV